MKSFLQFLIIGLGSGATYALFAQGAVLIYRGSGLVNFAQGALGTLSAYLAFIELRTKHGWATLPACVVGILGAVVVALLFQRIVLRRLSNAAAIVRVISTIGLLGLVQAVVEKRYGGANQPVTQYLPHSTLRHRRGEDPRGAHHPRGDLDRRDHRAVGVDALHPGRPGDQRQRRERACRADARLVAQPPGGDHLGSRWGTCRPRRSLGGTVDRVVDHDVHDRRHHRRSRRSTARRLPLVPDDVRRRLDHRSQRVDGHAVQGRRRAMVPPESDHRPAAGTGLPGDPSGARRPRARAAVALARQRSTSQARHRSHQLAGTRRRRRSSFWPS